MIVVQRWTVIVGNVGGWAGGNILVQWGLLLVPRDAHARSFGKNKVELRAEHTSSTSGSCLAQLLQGGPFFGNDHFDDEVVPDAHTALAVHVAERAVSDVAPSAKFAVNVALNEVGLPARLDLLAGNGTGVIVKDALSLSADFAGVLGASRGNGLLRLLDAPIELAEAPARLRVIFGLRYAREAHFDAKVANGMDDGWQFDRCGKVGGRENADRVLIRTGDD